MAPNPRVAKAFKAMRQIGIAEEVVKPVLKNLLKLYEKNWELIEEENYRALADAIFDAQDAEAAEQRNRLDNPAREEILEEEAHMQEEAERPLKRLRLRHQEGQTLHSLGTSSSTGPPQSQSRIVTAFPEGNIENRRSDSQPVSPQSLGRNKGKQPALPVVLAVQEGLTTSQAAAAERTRPDTAKRIESESVASPRRLKDKGKEPLLAQEKRPILERPSNGVRFKEPKVEPDVVHPPKQKSLTLIKPKDEPVTDDIPHFEVPIAVIHPESVPKGDSTNGHDSIREVGGSEFPTSKSFAEKDRTDGIPAYNEKENGYELATVADESAANLEIASSFSGEVKISISCNSALGGSDFRMPSPDVVLKTLEDKCLRSYKILDPNFSLKNLMKDMCECFLELGSDSTYQPQVAVDVTPPIDLLKKCCAADAGVSKDMPSGALSGSVHSQSEDDQIVNFPLTCNGVDDKSEQTGVEDGAGSVVQNSVQESAHAVEQNGLEERAQPVEETSAYTCENEKEIEPNGDEDANSRSLVVVQQCQLTPHDLSSTYDAKDLAKGQEKVVISLVNEINDECPPSFHYIPQNAVFQNAYVNFSLARIGDDNCCPTCLDDCLSASTPCACALQSGGEFAYTSEGLVKEELLKECISMNRDPQKHCRFYCTECPIERAKNEEILEPCKGHSVRKFIKECWWKCGCSRQCGNRVVQRGINRKLQVFMPPGGKGWGLRTLEDLPKGAFVCEYVGEVLTNAELYDRVSRSSNKDEHAYPVLLDADWASERDLKDEEALCLDATYFGNVARFINHRCYDSTLVEIPVEVETPDHHYYHLAFFTTRKVKALEELTWDYGIDFDDNEHPVKAFQCRCGSKFCRNIKRSGRSRAVRR